MALDKLDFAPGDQVQLKSGGPPMTVREFTEIPGHYTCNWFSGDKLNERHFRPEQLAKAVDARQVNNYQMPEGWTIDDVRVLLAQLRADCDAEYVPGRITGARAPTGVTSPSSEAAG